VDPAGDVAPFAAELLGTERVEVDYEPRVGWTVAAPTWYRRSVAATSEWGTGRADAVELLQAAVNQVAPTVYDYDADGGRLLNSAETAAAGEKAEAIVARFGAWVWEDPERSARLAEVYNRRFNSLVLPVYCGGHLSVPGLSAAFTPRAHQLDGAWRMICEPTVLLGHFVGAGTTATMIIGGRVLKRMGLIHLPVYVVQRAFSWGGS
jgi:N12 class adenine-specific DNA methylase